MAKQLDLSKLTEQQLLELRICELPLSLGQTWLASCVRQLYRELAAKEISFKPTCYLADEWLTPDGEPVVGIPFFLAHPSLMRLERKMMLDVEGGTKPWCMKLLRHEAGHAINYAYKLHRRKKWQRIFGQFSQEYTDTYRFRPYSRRFVRHLEDYYAQYHPDEDFAETFAVWLTPDLDWKSQYQGWKALIKLNYVDEVMREIRGKEPRMKAGRKYWEAGKLRSTLENYYKKKRRFYAEDFFDFHDSNLRKIFKEKEKKKRKVTYAADLIQRYRKDIIQSVSLWTGEKKYIIDNLLKSIIERSKSLKLVLVDVEDVVVLKFSAYVTALIMNYIYTGRFRKEK